MAKRKKPDLRKALKQVDSLPDQFFGKINIDIRSLPCITKPDKEKITANFDTDLLSTIRSVAEKHNISYSVLMNDVLREVFIKGKKVS